MLTIILIPYAFYRFDNKKRIFYALGYIVAILYILVIPLRYFVNGKASVTYKLASLWIIALMLITAAQAFDELLRKRKKDSLIIMPIVAAVILLMTKKLYIDGIVSNRLYASLIVMVIYIVLIGLGVIIKKNYIICMVLPLVLLEVCWASYNVINNRGVLDKSQLEDKVWYNDYSNEAIEYIEENVQSNYRVDKEYMSTFLCDSLYQEYNGTMAYVGGAAGNNNTNEFYYTLGFPTYSTNHYMFGFAQSTAINTLLNVGYTLTNNDEVSQYGYEKEMTTGNVNVFRNMNALPLGMTYSKYILKEDFEKCTIAQKRNIIMKACVVDSVEDAVGLEPLEYEDMQDTLYYVPDIERYKQEITPTTDNGRLNIITDPLDDENVLVLKMKMNNNDSTLYVGSGATAFGSSILFYANSQEYKIYSSFMKGEDEYIYEFSVPGTDTVSFEITDSMSLENLEVYIIPKEIYYQEYLSEVEGLSKADVSSETIETNLFEMEYNLQKSQLVYFSTPYDKGWHVYVDGVEQDLKQVNIAFMGTYVEEGEHIIELKYENHDKYYICTIIGALMYICLGIYQRKTKREKLLCEEE
jgi:uncharacterized membrane protein YfhO